jgi:alcohol dehydrogenase class IV
MNIAAARGQNERTVARFDEVARLLTGIPAARAEDGVRLVEELRASLQIPRLREYSIPKTALPDIAAKAAQSSSMKGNPVSLSHPQLVEILEEAW